MASETITVRVPAEVQQALATEAERRGCALADVVREAVSRHLNETRDTQALAGLEARLLERINTCETHVIKQLESLVMEA